MIFGLVFCPLSHSKRNDIGGGTWCIKLANELVEKNTDLLSNTILHIFSTYIMRTVKPKMEKLGVKDDLRNLGLKWLTRLVHKQNIETAKQLFAIGLVAVTRFSATLHLRTVGS